ncbi:MAG: hypothetical protein ACOCYQ_02475 [Alkalispirochaeta sp.]
MSAKMPAQDSADLFAEIFGGEPAREEVVLTVGVNGMPAGQISGITDFSTLEIAADELATLLRDRLVEDTADAYAAAVGTGLIPVADAERLGVRIIPDLGRLHLDVELPAEAMTVQPFGLSFRRSGPAVEPERYSGFLNVTGRVQTSETRSLLIGSLGPSVWIHGYVLRGDFGLLRPFDGVYRDGEEVFSVNRYELLRDFRPQQLRVSLGTVQTNVPGPFASVPLLGVSGDRTITMIATDPLIGRRELEFAVPAAGVHRVFVNDSMVATQRVSRGSYRIDNLRLENGLNRVAIEPGESFLVPWSNQLVRRGKHRWSVSAGVYEEETSRPGASGYWTWGALPNVTVGGVGQIDDTRSAVGALGRVATRAGISEMIIAGSFGDAADVAVTGEHTVALPLYDNAPTASVGFEYLGEKYRYLTDEDGASVARTRIGVSASVGYAFDKGPSFYLSGQWQERYGGSQRTSVSLGGNQKIGGSGALSFRLGPEWINETMRWTGAIYLRIFPGGGQVATSVTYDVTEGPAAVSLYPQPGDGVSRFGWNAQFSGFDQEPGRVDAARAQLGYEAYRWRVTAAPRVSRDVESDELDAAATFEGAAAVVFAGSSVSVTKPVQSGFVIFTPRSTIDGYRIGIQPQGDDYQAVIGRIPGVIPTLRAYQSNLISLDGTALPDGLSLGETTYRFDPVLNAGYRVVVGSLATVYVTGTLVDELNRNPGLAFGLATDETGTEVPFFSDETGYFEIHGLTPGRYTLDIDADGRRYTAEIAIDEDVQGLVDLGPVVINEGDE